MRRSSCVFPIQNTFSAPSIRFRRTTRSTSCFSFTESVSLRQYVEEHGVLSWAQCEQFFYPVIHTLGAIHAQNVEHLGISPNTLRITKDDKMIVTGFDIQSVRRAGTDIIEDIFPGCWALEQYSKTKICDEVTDVYGLCASLLFALRAPRHGSAEAQAGPAPDDLQKYPKAAAGADYSGYCKRPTG